METILDTLASSKQIFIIAILLLTIVFAIIIIKLKLLKKGIAGISISILLLGAIIFLASVFWSNDYGYVHHITHLSVNKNKICFLDSRLKKLAPYSTRPKYDMSRLFIADIDNGKCLFRADMGLNVKWLKDKENLILFSNSETWDIFDIDKTEVIRKINKDYLAGKFAELSGGIDNIDFIKEYLTIKTKNGHNYYYEPFSDKIFIEPDTSCFRYKKYFCFYDKITYIENGRERDIFAFKPIKPGEKLTHLFNLDESKIDKPKYSEESFIEGTCLGFFPENNIMLLLSYENTDKEKFVFTALNMDLKTLWKINHETLAPSDKFSPEKPLVTDAVIHNNYFFFGIGGFVYCIGASSGKIKWKQRF